MDPDAGEVAVHDAPRGRGPYGMDATDDGTVWFASLAGSYIARIDGADGALTTVDTPTPRDRAVHDLPMADARR